MAITAWVLEYSRRVRGRRSDRTGRARVVWLARARRAVVAAAAGTVLYGSFPPRDLWWLAPVAFVMFASAVRGQDTRAGFAHGVLFGWGFFLPLLPWIGVYVGPLPWIALATLEALIVGLAGSAIAGVSLLPLAPLWISCIWVAAEALMARFPFGGFPWGKVAFSQTDGPLLGIASVGGAPLVGFAVVLIGAGAGEVITRLATGQMRRAWVPAVVALLTVAVVVALMPVGGHGQRTVTVAAIQGNVPRLGLDFNAQRRAVLDNHVRVTEQLARDVAAGRQRQPDLVIWPENASDIDPLRNPDAAAAINSAAAAIGVPIHVGAVLATGLGKQTTNTSLVWEPGVGPTGRVDKRRVVPFGEYLPWRSFFRLLSPYADRAGYFVPGNGTGVLPIAGIPVGIAICWEVAFDDLVRDSVRNGAQILAVPSNNATFGNTEMTYQQQAMSRLRAVEHDRAVVVAATSGSSAIISPEGTVMARSGVFTPAALVERVPLRTRITLATQWGAIPEWLLTIVGVIAVVAGHSGGLRRRRGRRRATGGGEVIRPHPAAGGSSQTPGWGRQG